MQQAAGDRLDTILINIRIILLGVLGLSHRLDSVEFSVTVIGRSSEQDPNLRQVGIVMGANIGTTITLLSYHWVLNGVLRLPCSYLSLSLLYQKSFG